MKRMRDVRKQALIRDGFLPFEAQELSKVKKPSPYFEKLIHQRRALRMNAKKHNWSEAEYTRRVKATYEQERLVRRIPNEKGQKLSAWDLLRRLEDRYKDRHPAYESPTTRKISGTRSFNYGALEKPRKRKEKFGGKPYG